ncbi:tetratricopeptide repeat-containing sensor histidine kinase [Catalinimonas alkaloidigena]|uniref:tetratricopeptide repeat-containing sensor histidine kinase n=1 Tax=Catalinimonas alkaloidigena TaxID=1075417 RepID=UPI002405D408|nr:tetratricopeptide repeat-containing sensor histidine kinase [Catalinimonas alkaloidigena]
MLRLGNKSIKYLLTSLRISPIYLFLLLFSVVANYSFGYAQSVDKDSLARINGLIEKSIVKSNSEPSVALELALEALTQAEYIGDEPSFAKAYYSVGLAYDVLGEDQLALNYFFLALDKYKTLNDKLEVGNTLNNIGVVYNELGDYNEALSYYIQALQTIKGLNTPDCELKLYNNIGLIYITNGLETKALESLNKAYQLGVQHQLEDAITFPLHNLGDAYLNFGKYDSALHYFLKSYKVDNSLNDRQGLAINLQSMGKVYIAQRQYEQAESHLIESLDILTEIGDKYEQTNTLTMLGKLYYETETYPKAILYSEKALAFAQESNTKDQIREAAEILSDINRKLSNFKSALLYSDLSNTYKDSIYNDIKSKQLVLLELNKKEVENAALLTENEYKASIMDDQQILIEKQTYAVIFVSLGLVLSFIAVSVLVNSNKDKNLANQKLIKQKVEIEKIIRELTTLNDNINKQKNELQQSNQIKDKLLSIISHDFRSPLNSLEGILDLITQGRISPDEMKMVSKELRVKVNITTCLLDNLLNWAKSQMQGINTNPTYFDIKELVSDTIHLLSTQAEKKDIRIYNRVVHHQEVFADYEMTKLVVRNLISNAIKFTVAGDKIFIKSIVKDEHLVVIVKDTGKGISKEDQVKLFTNEAKSTLGTAYEKGTGIGLLLCKDFVEKNGGIISIESEEGEGSTFKFSIPVAENKWKAVHSKKELSNKE